MLKYYNYIFLALFLIITVKTSGQLSIPKVPAERQKYDAYIKLIKEAGYNERFDKRYTISDGKVTTENFTDRKLVFDIDGKLKEMIYLDKSSRKIAIVVFNYTQNGLPNNESEFHPTGELLKRTDYIYENNYLKEKVVIDQYGYVLRKLGYHIDNVNKSVEERTYSAPQMLSGRDIWYYDNLETGKMVKHEVYDGEHVFKFKRSLIHSNNKVSKEIYYNPAGAVAFYLEYEYDLNGNLSQIEKVLLDGTRLKKQVSQYNSAGLITGRIDYDRYGKIKSYYKFTYK